MNDEHVGGRIPQTPSLSHHRIKNQQQKPQNEKLIQNPRKPLLKKTEKPNNYNSKKQPKIDKCPNSRRSL